MKTPPAAASPKPRRRAAPAPAAATARATVPATAPTTVPATAPPTGPPAAPPAAPTTSGTATRTAPRATPQGTAADAPPIGAALPVRVGNSAQRLPLPHERDQGHAQVAAEPDARIAQAHHDLRHGQVDTDLRATPGLDAARRAGMVASGGTSAAAAALETPAQGPRKAAVAPRRRRAAGVSHDAAPRADAHGAAGGKR